MNTVLGYSQALLEERKLTEEKVKTDAKDIKEASTNLLELINNILDISRIESGKEEIEAKDYKIEELLREVNSLITSKIKQDEVDFKINVDSNIPISYKGDADKIYKIIVNILLNAIDNTKFGNVSLDVGGAYVGSVFKLSLIVANTGHVMSEEEFKKDFDEFSDEYRTYSASIKEEIKAFAAAQKEKRPSRLKEDAMSEYRKGRKEYEDGLAEYTSKISEAEEEIREPWQVGVRL